MSLNTLLFWLLTYKYFLILPLTIVQGPILMVLGGFLLRQGYFHFWPLYFTLLFGDFIGDIIWYQIGFFGAGPLIKKYGRFLNLSEDLFKKLEDGFRRHATRILLISKLTMGFGFALTTLVAEGISRVPFRKYLILNLIGGFFWTGFLVASGFFFGHLYLIIDKGFRFAALLAFAVLGIIALWGFHGYMRKRFLKVL